ncbi:MAG: rod shape-determining protein [Alphaproteobacteria bacterium]|nr:rod shape-determining protein [Alphaproteobacteria bacterium]
MQHDDQATTQTPVSGQQLMLGIDLGTSRTAIMSSRGTKETVRSVVGYPKDLIGIKLLGAPMIVGDAAYEKRAFLDLRYPLEDGVLREYGQRDIEVARDLMGYVIGRATPKPDDTICAVIGVPARASKANKTSLLRMAQEVVDMALVVSEPFMVAYGQNKLLNSLVIDIGAGTVDICGLKGTMPGPEDQVTLTKAGNFIDERLQAAILERYPHVQMNLNVACAIKEEHAFVGHSPGPINVSLRSGGKPVICDVSEPIKAACEAMLPEIIENMKVLVEAFPPEDQSTVLRNIILAGGGSQIRGLAEVIAANFNDYGDVHVTRVSDPTYDGCSGALKLAQELPPKYWGQLGDMIGF